MSKGDTVRTTLRMPSDLLSQVYHWKDMNNPMGHRHSLNEFICMCVEEYCRTKERELIDKQFAEGMSGLGPLGTGRIHED